MARIAGIDLPKNKVIKVALTSVYGIGNVRAGKILEESGVPPETRVRDLTDSEVASIRKVLDGDFKIEGDLRKEVAANIKRIMDIGSYRGLRHRKNLPVRGQRTRTNARTRKGRRRGAVVMKKGR